MGATHDHVTEFRIEAPQAELDDLRARLEHARWPERETVDDWSQGVPLAYLRDLCRYWADGYDWRAQEKRLNQFTQFKTKIDGLYIHFVHQRSSVSGARPLLLLNGWPSSFDEYSRVIGPLTDPVRYGGRAEDAFDVVIPAMPGYGFSDKPSQRGYGNAKIAAGWATLMTRLGYTRYGVVASDIGITRSKRLCSPGQSQSGCSRFLFSRISANFAAILALSLLCRADNASDTVRDPSPKPILFMSC